MMGRSYTDDTLRKAAEADGSATVTALEDPTGAAAADIAAGDIGLVRRSERSRPGPSAPARSSPIHASWRIGSRSTGSRDGALAALAPACLEDRMSTFLAGGPATSPHMLFTYSVKFRATRDHPCGRECPRPERSERQRPVRRRVGLDGRPDRDADRAQHLLQRTKSQSSTRQRMRPLPVARRSRHALYGRSADHALRRRTERELTDPRPEAGHERRLLSAR